MGFHEKYRPRAAAGERPNVLILMSDQHRYDLMGCAPGSGGGGARRNIVFAELSPLREHGQFMARTACHKLVHTRGLGDELYDLKADAGEYHNRIADPAAGEILARLRRRMAAELVGVETRITQPRGS